MKKTILFRFLLLPKAGFDLAAVVGASLVFTGQGQISEVIQSNSRVIGGHQNLSQTEKVNIEY